MKGEMQRGLKGARCPGCGRDCAALQRATLAPAAATPTVTVTLYGEENPASSRPASQSNPGALGILPRGDVCEALRLC